MLYMHIQRFNVCAPPDKAIFKLHLLILFTSGILGHRIIKRSIDGTVVEEILLVPRLGMMSDCSLALNNKSVFELNSREGPVTYA